MLILRYQLNCARLWSNTLMIPSWKSTIGSLVVCPLKVKMPFWLYPDIRLSCERRILMPNAIWCLPRLRSTSSAIEYVLMLKKPGAQVPQPTVKLLVIVICMFVGVSTYILTPRSFAVGKLGDGPR